MTCDANPASGSCVARRRLDNKRSVILAVRLAVESETDVAALAIDGLLALDLFKYE